MSDQDRGAYTPQPDAPLQFDARGPRGGRRPLPMTLIGSAGVLVVLLGALALHYQHGVRGEGEPARPVGEPIPAIRAAAPAGAQARDPARDPVGLDVYGAKSGEPAKIPTFAAPPEPVQPRAAPRGLTVQMDSAAPSKLAAAPSTSAPPTGKTTTAAAVATLPTKPAPNASAVVAKVADTPAATTMGPKAAPSAKVAKSAPSTAQPAPLKAASEKAGSAKTVGAGGSPVVQIGAFSSNALADKGWSDVSSAMSGEMAGKSKRIEALEKNGSTLYRTSVTGFSSRASADAFCSGLKAKGKICFVKQ